MKVSKLSLTAAAISLGVLVSMYQVGHKHCNNEELWSDVEYHAGSDADQAYIHFMNQACALFWSELDPIEAAVFEAVASQDG